MARVRGRGEQIRQFILTNVEGYSKNVAALTAQEFGITRQAVNKHIKSLVEQKAIEVKGSTKSRSYHLLPSVKWKQEYQLANSLEEDVIWDANIKPLVADLPNNVRDIWLHGFTEILNNAIDHSSGSKAIVNVERTAIYTEIIIRDDGDGIFRKIQRELQLRDERGAALELVKGKLTTDPDRHSGEGIFFTSRMFDSFTIFSGSACLTHKFSKVEDWIFQIDRHKNGTAVIMKLNNNTSRTCKQVFDSFSLGDNYGFTKTVIPVRVAQYGDERLVSRSQAKRLLTGVDKFKIVLFDFSGVEAIGQAFADEVFRVFRKQHPEMEIVAINATEEITQMISRAESSF